VLYILNLTLQGRREEKNKKIQLSNTMLQTLYREETTRSCGELLNYSWTDMQDFLSKYDSTVNPESFAKRMSVFNIFESLGYLLRNGLIDMELIYVNGGMTSISLWAKFKPVMEEYRKIAYGSDMFSNFEYFAEEMWKIKRARDPSFLRDQTLGIDFLKIFG